MTTIVGPGDRLQTVSGRPSWLKRGSVPFAAHMQRSSIGLLGDRWISYGNLYRQQPWVAVAANKLGRQMSRLPLKPYLVDSAGDRERIRDGVLPDLLETPSARKSPVDLKQAWAFSMLVHGNSTTELISDELGGPWSRAIPRRWQLMHPILNSIGELEGWEYRDPDDRRFIGKENVLHLSWWSPDGDVGVSPLEQLGVTIQSEDAAQRFTAAAFKNGIKSSGAFVTPPDVHLKEGEEDRMREKIKQSQQGVDNALNFLLLSGGVKFEAFQQTAREAELIDVRKVNREEVLAVYDVPPPMAGVLDNATYSNIDTQHGMLYTDVLGPHMVLIEEQFKAQVLAHPAYDNQFVEFDFAEVLRGDKLKEITALRNGLQTGIYTLNDVRRILNLKPYANDRADQPLIPGNNLIPLDQLGRPPAEVDDELGKHLRRVGDRVVRKSAAGEELALFDADRFKRELTADLAESMGEKAEPFAATWAEVVAAGVDSAEDTDQLRGFFEAVTTTR